MSLLAEGRYNYSTVLGAATETGNGSEVMKTNLSARFPKWFKRIEIQIPVR